MEELKKVVREVPDFPKEGILFYDITTLIRLVITAVRLIVYATERSIEAPIITKVCPTATIPRATDMPLPTPNVAERVTTSATLVLGIMASVAIIANSEIASIMLIFIYLA